MSGLLGEFADAGVLGLADLHVARRVSRLGGEHNESVQLAFALAVRALRTGSVCVELEHVGRTVVGEAEEAVDFSALPWPDPPAWLAACANSPLVARGEDGPAGRPLRLTDGLLYLDRYWRHEELVRTELRRRAAAPPPALDADRLGAALDRLFPGSAPDQQRAAAEAAASGWLTVIAGGPGTGKTTTVARLLAVLCDQPGPPPRIALAAPTGKAAARLSEAVSRATATLPAADAARLGSLQAATLHRLLRPLYGSRTRFRHNRANRLPYDVVVVDETSMVALSLMARLVDAVRPAARLVLVGDPDQLASVEAGAVLGDLVSAPALAHRVVTLGTSWRFGGAISVLAGAVRRGDADAALAVLRSGSADVEFVAPDDPAGLDRLRAEVVGAARTVSDAARAGDIPTALKALDAHRLLCGHRRGPYGVAWWAAQVESWLPREPSEGEWYPGRPLLVTANDYDVGLHNGDTGVVVRVGDEVRAAFARGGEPVLVAPTRLSTVQTVHAMTVHRGQGSQFRRVSLILPPADSPLLTRELLYTAITRAESGLRIVGTAEAVEAAVRRPITRASGLVRRLVR